MLSDPHGGEDEASDRALLELLRRAEGRADLLILGDLFTAWLGPRRFHTPFQREVLRRIHRVRQSGRKVTFVVGNRDYLVEDRFLPGVFDRICRGESLVAVEQVPTWVCHGDQIVSADWPYRLWRRVSRARPVARGLERVPARLGRALAAGAQRALAPLNAGFKTGALPIAALEALGRRAFERGATRALVGHFHHGLTIPVPGGAPVQIAPAWPEYREVLVSHGSALTPTPLGAL